MNKQTKQKKRIFSHKFVDNTICTLTFYENGDKPRVVSLWSRKPRWSQIKNEWVEWRKHVKETIIKSMK